MKATGSCVRHQFYSSNSLNASVAHGVFLKSGVKVLICDRNLEKVNLNFKNSKWQSTLAFFWRRIFKDFTCFIVSTSLHLVARFVVNLVSWSAEAKATKTAPINFISNLIKVSLSSILILKKLMI